MKDLFLGRINPNLQAPEIPRSKIGEPGKQDGQKASFSEILKDSINEVNDLQKRSSEEIQKLMTGEVTDVHTALIAVQKADTSFQLMMQIRNKIVQAYQEIMRMQV